MLLMNPYGDRGGLAMALRNTSTGFRMMCLFVSSVELALPEKPAYIPA
jgi:hypothetical protein